MATIESALAAEQQARERTERLLQVTEALGRVLAVEDAAQVIVENVAPLIQPQLDAKGLRYRVEIDDATEIVSVDRDKLRQIVLNLLANAVKFTDARGVDGRYGEIVVDTLIDAARPQMIRLRVHDNGIGIPAHMQDSIFEPFTQVDSALTRAHEGTGLGLAISRELARGMGGDVSVVSELGAGSTFAVTLLRAPHSGL